ncbi:MULTISPECIES: hypothetical protein [Leisingera]|uniref:hypothetical protein n=1 Tax=Leisingera TaxID=191028 RepID=UPI00048206FF|nr:MULTISPECIES: hypothetical protein [Leisingera]
MLESSRDNLQILAACDRVFPISFGQGRICSKRILLSCLSVSTYEGLVDEIGRNAVVPAIRIAAAVEVDCFPDIGMDLRKRQFGHGLCHDTAFRSVSFRQVALRQAVLILAKVSKTEGSTAFF